MPDWPTGSSAEPLRYQTMCVTTGTRRSGTTTTSSPLSRLKDDTSGPPPSVRPKGAASVRSVAAPDVSAIHEASYIEIRGAPRPARRGRAAEAANHCRFACSRM